jgi:hypothetical protein
MGGISSMGQYRAYESVDRAEASRAIVGAKVELTYWQKRRDELALLLDDCTKAVMTGDAGELLWAAEQLGGIKIGLESVALHLNHEANDHV